MAGQESKDPDPGVPQVDELPTNKPAPAPPVQFGHFSPIGSHQFGIEVPFPNRKSVPSGHHPVIEAGPAPSPIFNLGKDLTTNLNGDQALALKAVEDERDSLRAEIRGMVLTHRQELLDTAAKLGRKTADLEREAQKACESLVQVRIPD